MIRKIIYYTVLLSDSGCNNKCYVLFGSVLLCYVMLCYVMLCYQQLSSTLYIFSELAFVNIYSIALMLLV